MRIFPHYIIVCVVGRSDVGLIFHIFHEYILLHHSFAPTAFISLLDLTLLVVAMKELI